MIYKAQSLLLKKLDQGNRKITSGSESHSLGWANPVPGLHIEFKNPMD